MKPIAYALLMVFFSCSVSKNNQNSSSAEKVLTASDTMAISEKKRPPYNPVDIDTVKILREVYVTTFKGAEVFDEKGKSEWWGLPFGIHLAVIKEFGDELRVISISRGEQNAKTFYRINKKDTDLETEIPLPDHYLNEPFSNLSEKYKVITEPSYWIRQDYYTNESLDRGFDPAEIKDIQISSVTREAFFLAQPKGKKLFFTNDAVKKVNGTITIAGKQFKDSTNDPYQNIYTYIGEYPFLNAYVLEYMCSECEEYSYEVVSKKDGSVMGSYSSFPYYSPDKNTIISVGQLFSDSPIVVSVYKASQKDEVYAYKEFGSWIPVGNAFWGTDGNFYTEAIPYITAVSYYNNKEKRDREQYNYRYLQIKIKGPTTEYNED
ncbi:hypothetical protein GR160_16800 [Flavobacterium sp. Sd200]|uniref:hypothetical protein n=1 Tax=Flavobacterium sp. Sd200 TaxID=2692211 RepID=UPI00136D87C8|nr:hypothetical protein [Flavobacterium sp. Sd200]MXN92887.1 hypothetical protein [Flavobacterium sp. Sd200]